MAKKLLHRRKPFHISLRFTVAFGVVIPTFIIFSLFAYRTYVEEKEVLEIQTQQTAELIGEIMLKSMNHAMMEHDFQMAENIILDFNQLHFLDEILRVRLINNNHQVIIDNMMEKGLITDEIDVINDPDCVFCHVYPPEQRNRSQRIPSSPDQMRIAIPIINNSDCQECHSSKNSNLGLFLIDMSMDNFDEHIQFDLREDLHGSLISIVLISIFIYGVVTFLVIRRVERFREPISQFSIGNFSARVGDSTLIHDELCDLADATNQMADQIETLVREEREITEWKERTLSREREHISHELHDGLAQILGFIKNKTKAARLMVSQSNLEKAERYLTQLEEAAHEISIDVSETILGLRMSSKIGQGLDQNLKELASEFTKHNNILVTTSISPEIKLLNLDTEEEYQILRIVQEALTNIRKHSHSEEGAIETKVIDDWLWLTISDFGQGIVKANSENSPSGFGLRTMQERAETIRGEFSIESKMGQGTIINIKVPINQRMK